LIYSNYQEEAAFISVFDEILSLPPKTYEGTAKEIAVFSFSNIGKNFKFEGTSNFLDSKSIPSKFRETTRKATKSQWERTKLVYLDDRTEPGIVVGNNLTISGVGKYEFYVIFSLAQQERTMSLIFNYLLCYASTDCTNSRCSKSC
jgi:two-component system sensor histidine kinase MtrB